MKAYIRTAFALFALALSFPSSSADLAGRLSIEATIRYPGDFMAFGFGSLWMMSGSKLLRINPADNSVSEIRVQGAGGKYRGIAIGEAAVWIPDLVSQTIYKVDPRKNEVVLKIPAELVGSEGSIGVGAGSVWAVTGVDLKQLSRYDVGTGAQLAQIALPMGSTGVAFDFGAVWISVTSIDQLIRVDPAANLITATIPLHPSPRFLTTGKGSVWVLNQGDGTVQRIDGKTSELTATIDAQAAGGGGDIAFGGESVWLTTHDVLVIKIDPATERVQGNLDRPRNVAMGDAVRYGAGSLWISGESIFRIKPP